ncbi:MAG: DMT family transporter [Campylobacter curvus]
MAWIYLICAGLMEMGWPVGLKMAQREIPIGTSYAVWTSIGAAGTFLIGVWFYGDAASLWKYFGVLLILSGVVVLKVAP